MAHSNKPQDTGALIMKWKNILFATMILGATSIAPAGAEGLADLFDSTAVETNKKEFLKVEQAFNVKPTFKGDKVTVNVNITPGHYVYKDKFKLILPDGVTASNFSFSKSEQSIDDPYFGKVAVFEQNPVTATATLTNTTTQPIKQAVTLTWQGCAKAGLCYPPQKETVEINLLASNTNKAEQKSDLKESAKSITDSSKNSKSIESKKAVTVTSSEPKTTNQSANKPDVENDAQKNITSLNGPVEAIDQRAGSDGTKITDIQTDTGLDSNNDGTDGNLFDSQELALEELNNTNTDGLKSPDGQKNSGLLLSDVVDQDPFGLAKHPWLALGLLFLAGLGLAFTPCVLPMLPIVSNIVARQHNPTAKKGLVLSGSYALGVAIAYGILGAIIAIFGQSLGIIGWLQNPVILVAFAIIFILLALYMLDVFRLPVPNKIKQKMQSVSQAGDRYLGSTFGSFIAGLLSALVISPCVSAPLFGALLAVSTIGNPLLGFAALFMLGFGLSSPLMLLGVSQGNLMPKAGEWMNWVKQGFALLLFAVALLLIERVLISPIMLIIWAIWFMVVASWIWSWSGRGVIFSKAMAVIFVLWSAITLVGAAMGSQDVWQPLSSIKSSSQSIENNVSSSTESINQKSSAIGNQKVNSATNSSDLYMTSLDELIPVIQKKDKVLVDLTAEWCVECRIMDKTLFTNRPASLQGWQVVRLDVTETTEESKRILSELKLFGPPALLYFVDGKLQVQQVGNVARTEFEQTLARL